MSKTSFQNILQKEITRKEFLSFSVFAVASIFGIVGLIRELASRAATPTASAEAEAGTVSAPATKVTDTQASGSQAVKFGTVAPGDGFVLGVTEPNATNTGVPDSKIFAAADIITTDITITTVGTVIDGKEIHACITVKAANVTIKNCRIIGPQSAPANRPLIYHIDAAVSNFRLERCTVRPTLTSASTDTLMGHSITRIRNNISRGVDGSGSYINPAFGTNCNYLVQGDYIHDLAYYCPTTTQGDNHTHNDGNQQHNGTNVTFEGVAIHGYWDPNVGDGSVPGTFQTDPTTGKVTCLSGNCNDNYGTVKGRRNVNATFQIAQVTGGITDDFHIINSWVYGGASTINILDTKLAMTKFEIRGNRFEVPMYGRNAIINANSASSAIIQCSGNTYMDTGLPMLGTVGNGRQNKV